jgi:RNA polymerase sigma-70 factor (ECF subfamily)
MTWPFPASDEQTMWRLSREDDPGAFAELVRRWEIPVQRMCARMTGDLHRGEDLAQETFARVFAHRHSFAAEGRFSTWMWRIAVNLCHDELRRRARRPESPLPGEGSDDGVEGAFGQEPAAEQPTPAEALEQLEAAEQVRQAVARLPEHYRAVVVLRHYEGLRFAEIAEVLGIPVGTVKSRMAEGLDRLGVWLETVRREETQRAHSAGNRWKPNRTEGN